MQITIHFDTRANDCREYEYGVTLTFADGGSEHLSDLVAIDPKLFESLDAGPIDPETAKAIRGAGELANVANAGRLTPPEIDAIADGAGWGTITVL